VRKRAERKGGQIRNNKKMEEAGMKKLKKDLQAINKELATLIKKTEALMSAVDKIGTQKTEKKSKEKKVPTAKKTATKSAFDTVLGIVGRYRKGVNVTRIQELTGYDAKKIANIVYKGKKRGQIKSIDKGVYLKA
jgi:type II secretory pathway component PulF